MDISVYKSGIIALGISIICTPILIRISRKKGFFASMNHRSSHDTSIPNTGGIIIFFAVLVPSILYSDFSDQEDFSLLISAFAVLLITGIIDDFNPIPVAFKFLGQFIPAIVIVTSIDEQELIIPFLNDIYQFPFIFNYLFWITFIVMTINAFNLIDGIDGLAIGLGIIGSVFYFIKFLDLAEYNLTIFALSLSTGLAGLLFYNISVKHKIFIGDTGSLLIGGLLVFFALKFISLSEETTKNSSIFMVIGSIFIPLADMVRITLVRLFKGNSPFRADRQHIHHLILDLLHGNHLITTGILIICQAGILFLFQWFIDFDKPFYLPTLIFSFLVYFGLAYALKRLRDKLV